MRFALKLIMRRGKAGQVNIVRQVRETVTISYTFFLNYFVSLFRLVSPTYLLPKVCVPKAGCYLHTLLSSRRKSSVSDREWCLGQTRPISDHCPFLTPTEGKFFLRSANMSLDFLWASFCIKHNPRATYRI